MKNTKKSEPENSVSEKRFNRVMKIISLGFTILSVSSCFVWKVMSDKHRSLETESHSQARKEAAAINNQAIKEETIINQLFQLVKYQEGRIDSLGIIIKKMNAVNQMAGGLSVSGSVFENCTHAIETHSNIIMKNNNGEK